VKPLNVEKPPKNPVIQNNLAASVSILLYKSPIRKQADALMKKVDHEN
jgi:hypothetical protein